MKNKPNVSCWIARDGNNNLWLFYNSYPTVRQGDDGLWDCYDNESKDRIDIPDELFPELKFEDGPKKLKYGD